MDGHGTVAGIVAGLPKARGAATVAAMDDRIPHSSAERSDVARGGGRG